MTYPRSGSQTLVNVLNASDDIFIYSENNGFILDLLNLNIKASSTAGMLGYEDFHLSPSYFNYNIDTNSLKTDTLSLINNNIFNSDKKIKGWKEHNLSPNYFSSNKAKIYIKEIDSIFTNCLFIYNVRDPLKTSNSGYWRSVNNSYLLLNKWRDFYIDCYDSKLVKNSIFLDYDIWSYDFEYFSSKLNFLKLSNNLIKDIFFTKSNHLRDW